MPLQLHPSLPLKVQYRKTMPGSAVHTDQRPDTQPGTDFAGIEVPLAIALEPEPEPEHMGQHGIRKLMPVGLGIPERYY